MRRLLGLLLSVALLAGCQEEDSPLQGRVDSLRTANQNLTDQVQRLRDSLRTEDEGTTLKPPLYFPSGSAWLFNDIKNQLDEHAQTLKQDYPNADFRIQGYTDPVPIGPRLSDTYPSNWYLAAQRAAAVAHYLAKTHGIRSESLVIEAYGSFSQAESNQTPEPRPKQRRVEIVVQDGS